MVRTVHQSFTPRTNDPENLTFPPPSQDYRPPTLTLTATNTTPDPELRPCIAELLRTGYHPPDLTLRVERVIEVLFTPDTRTGGTGTGTIAGNVATSSEFATPTRRSYRVFLSDGELVIQALLGKALHRLLLAGEVRAGAVVRLERYEIRRGERIGGGSGRGQVVFLAVGGFRCLRKIGVGERGARRGGEGNDVEVRVVARKRKRGGDIGDEDDGGGFGRGEKARRIGDMDGAADIRPNKKAGLLDEDGISELLAGNLDDVFDSGSQSFGDNATPGTIQDTIKDDLGSPTPTQEQENFIQPQSLAAPNTDPSDPQRSEAVKLQSPPHITAQISHAPNERAKPTPIPTPTATVTHPYFKLPGILRPISLPLNLLTLSQLLHPAKPLPKRNYLCDVLAVISWISPYIIKRPYMPPKRDLRIMDPTIASAHRSSHDAQEHPQQQQQQQMGVSVSVFVDAASFNPPVGTVGLFRSLKTHEWEGVSLNAYEKDCKGREWFVCERGKLMGVLAEVGKGGDVEGLQKWWEGWCKGKKDGEESGGGGRGI
ncbi:hypothetical protein GX51_07393 [Blastomyces parvus]|uniref:Uncharacterized protein n=1 Tax=Blastomyces parvus TaxID=2060905 RepID=A0A2B7WL81_9EURO|nr:hypothetical protein GX51_07393 [Blastomyces parvus]